MFTSTAQCRGINKDGTQCKRPAGPSGFCWQHEDQSEEPKVLSNKPPPSTEHIFVKVGPDHLTPFLCPGVDQKTGAWIDLSTKTSEEKAQIFKGREDLHTKIIESFFRNKQSSSLETRRAFILMGGPGSGKSTYVGNYLCRQEDCTNFVMLNLDEIIVQLPEFHRALFYRQTEAGIETVREAAAGNFCYTEAYYILEHLLLRILKGGYSFIFDTTGGNLTTITKIMGQSHHYGYHIVIIYVDADVDEGWKRTQERAKKEGRLVTEPYLREVYKKAQGNLTLVLLNPDFREVGTDVYACNNRGDYTTQYDQLDKRCLHLKNVSSEKSKDF